MWKYFGQARPDFADTPGPDEESVWDFPRPPALNPLIGTVEVRSGHVLIARSADCVRVLETASPPTVYVPPRDVDLSTLVAAPGSSHCEWKGAASYLALAAAPDGAPVAWRYANPKRAFSSIRDWLSFYPGRVECFIDGERVRPQHGGFYGGWVTDRIVGPWKGGPGTSHW